MVWRLHHKHCNATSVAMLQLQETHDLLASKASLMEMQLVELRAQRLESLQVSPAGHSQRCNDQALASWSYLQVKQFCQAIGCS